MRVFYLKPCWDARVPVSVGASVDIGENIITVDFAVREPCDCYCQKKEQDGEAVWQDSCVEVFLKMLGGKKGDSEEFSFGSMYANAEYANFELNSKGVCYAARGKGRENRVEFSKDEYAKIIRKPTGISKENDFYRWMLSVQIPGALLGVNNDHDLRKLQIEGNIYKCADMAKTPHYLSAFPVNTPEPDFHRPEFFENLM